MRGVRVAIVACIAIGMVYYELVPVALLIQHAKRVYHIIPYFPAHKAHFFHDKCDLNSTWVLCAKVKYYFQTYKNPYIYYTSLSWDSEICFQIMRSDITVCERLTFLSGDLP